MEIDDVIQNVLRYMPIEFEWGAAIIKKTATPESPSLQPAGLSVREAVLR